MKLEVNITKARAFAIVGAILIFAGIFGAYAVWDTSKIVYHNAADVKVTIDGVNKSLQESITDGTIGGSSASALPGQILREDLVTGQTYTKVKELTVGESGTARVVFSLKTNGPAGTVAYAQIYRNGVPIGSEFSTASLSYVNMTSVTTSWFSGDKIQLYLKSSHNTYIAYNDFLNFNIYEKGAIVGGWIQGSSCTDPWGIVVCSALTVCPVGSVRYTLNSVAVFGYDMNLCIQN